MTNSPINKKQLNSNCSKIYNLLLLGNKVSLFTFKNIRNIHSRFYDIRKYLQDNYGIELKDSWSETKGTKHKTYWLTKTDIKAIKKGVKGKQELFSNEYLESIGFVFGRGYNWIDIGDRTLFYDIGLKRFELMNENLNIKTRSQLKSLISIL